MKLAKDTSAPSTRRSGSAKDDIIRAHNRSVFSERSSSDLTFQQPNSVDKDKELSPSATSLSSTARILFADANPKPVEAEPNSQKNLEALVSRVEEQYLRMQHARKQLLGEGPRARRPLSHVASSNLINDNSSGNNNRNAAVADTKNAKPVPTRQPFSRLNASDACNNANNIPRRTNSAYKLVTVTPPLGARHAAVLCTQQGCFVDEHASDITQH